MLGNCATGIAVSAMRPASVMTMEMTISQPRPIDEYAGKHGSNLRRNLGRLHDLTGTHLLHTLRNNLLARLEALGHRYLSLPAAQ